MFKYFTMTINAILGGKIGQTFSARCYEETILMGRTYWLPVMKFVNWLMGHPEHCKNAFYREIKRTHDASKYVTEMEQ